MRVALNGYFWDQRRTGSGQYLRHLWLALSEAHPPLRPARGAAPAEDLDLVMLLPGGGGTDDGRWTMDDRSEHIAQRTLSVHRPSSLVGRSPGSPAPDPRPPT